MKLALAWAAFCAVTWLAIHTEPERPSQISEAYPDMTLADAHGSDYRHAEALGFHDLSAVGYYFPLALHFTLSERDRIELRTLYQERVTATLAEADALANY